MQTAQEPQAMTPAALAKATLRRLAAGQLEPTPENYARAWAEEAGTGVPAAVDPKAQGQAWAVLIDRLVRHLERGGRQWTTARRKDSLQRVLQGSRSDAERLQQRLQSLLSAWDADRALDDGEPAVDAAAGVVAASAPEAGAAAALVPPVAPAAPSLPLTLATTLRHGLPRDDARAADLADRLGVLADRLQGEGVTAPLVQEVEQLCLSVQRWFGHRHELVQELSTLCGELSQSLGELAEDDSWARGQCTTLQARLAGGLNRRSLRAAGDLLADTRRHQARVRGERTAAREALKQLLARMLNEVGELGQHAGVFELAVERHAEAIAGADSLEGLAGVVQTMLDDSRNVRAAVSASQVRLTEQQARASELELRVRELETELRRISDEAATDALTQVANRRGLEQAFAAESARVNRNAGAQLAVGLIDIDNFKKLNDRLGHGAGDQALKSLAAAVRERLRPVDHLARFGGEEFVLLLPDTPLDDAQQALTRLQRSLSASLFLHEGEEVFVTFSAGVTLWRAGEPLEAALERADEALYEAKRTGKNRTCKS